MHIRKKCVLGLGLIALAAVATAQVKGPDPTAASIAADGPFAVSTQTVRGTGFGGGTVYSPNAAGTYGLVAFCPGFTATQSSITGQTTAGRPGGGTGVHVVCRAITWVGWPPR